MGVGTLVDSNVILDVLTEDADWCDWSAAMLADAARAGMLAINPIVYAEISARFERIEDLDEDHEHVHGSASVLQPEPQLFVRAVSRLPQASRREASQAKAEAEDRRPKAATRAARRPYSCRSASIGSSRAARTAGTMPKKMPTVAEKPRPMANDHQGSEMGKPDR